MLVEDALGVAAIDVDEVGKPDAELLPEVDEEAVEGFYEVAFP